MGQTENPVRYSIITDKNPREIVMLRGSGCRYLRCRFCDYHLDSSRNEEENYRINKEALSKVNGIYHSLEVINSGSFWNLMKRQWKKSGGSVKKSRSVSSGLRSTGCIISMYRSGRIILKTQGITLKIKMGVETFDDTFRREVFDKGMEGVMPEEIAGVADEVCLLFGISGQTAESMQKDIETGLKYFERICINIMVENTTPIRPDQEVIRLFCGTDLSEI